MIVWVFGLRYLLCSKMAVSRKQKGANNPVEGLKRKKTNHFMYLIIGINGLQLYQDAGSNAASCKPLRPIIKYMGAIHFLYFFNRIAIH
jgi:hypothetical protein